MLPMKYYGSVTVLLRYLGEGALQDDERRLSYEDVGG